MRNNEELYKKLENFIPNHKLGFKILKDDQLQNIFPTYETLIQKIDKHRENLNKHERISGLDSQYNLMYDNVYSIMGERGSGKTSALFTLKKKIEMDYPTDWVLPVIMPELIPSTGDIIGWILATLEEVVKELEEKIENNHNIRGDSAYFRDCKFVANNELRVTYEKVKDLHFSKKLPQYQTESFVTAMETNQAQALNGFEFSKAFSTFWNTLVDAIVKADKDSNTSTKEKNPLVYLMFDDVDLVPGRIMELLSAIIKYLAHPNLIVIITAEEGLFYKVVSKKLSDNLNIETMDTTAQLYVDKVMPPSSRFYLKKFDDCRKKSSFIQHAEGLDKEIQSETLEDFLRNKVNEYIDTRSTGSRTSDYDNFLYYEGDEKQFLQIYFLYWGNTSRQLVNESLIVADLIESLNSLYSKVTLKNLDSKQYKKQYEEQVYERIVGFIKSSIQSNLQLREMIKGVDEFVNKICNRNKTRWPIFINYEALEKFYFEQIYSEISDIDKKRIVENVIAIFVLLFFVENLLLIGDRVNDEWRISKERKYIHGAEHLVPILDSLLPDSMSLTKNSRNGNAVAEILYNYENILCNPMWLKKFSIYDYLNVKDYLYPLYTKAYKKKISFSDLNKWHTENPRWFTTMTKMVFLMSSGFFSLTKRTMRVFQWAKKIKTYDPYLTMMTNLEKENLKRQLIKSYQLVRKEKNTTSYQAYFDILYRTEVFHKLEDKLFYSGEIYFLEEIKEAMMNIVRTEIDANKDLLQNGIGSYEECLRVMAFLHVADEDIGKYNLLTKNVVENELQRIQNELVRKYSTSSTYYIKDKEKIEICFAELTKQEISLELMETVRFFRDETSNTNIIPASIANRLVELLDKEVCYDLPFAYRGSTIIEKCKKVLQENLKLVFWHDEESQAGMNIVILHEAQFYLQEMYTKMLLDEMKNVLKDQGVVGNSFYNKYLETMLEVLENSEYNHIGNLSRNEVEQRIYLGKYIQEEIRETVEKYIETEEVVLSDTSGESAYE